MKRITVKTHKQHISTDYSCTATSITHHKKIQAKIMKAITDCTKLYGQSFAFCDPIIYKHDSHQCFRPEYSQYSPLETLGLSSHIFTSRLRHWMYFPVQALSSYCASSHLQTTLTPAHTSIADVVNILQ